MLASRAALAAKEMASVAKGSERARAEYLTAQYLTAQGTWSMRRWRRATTHSCSTRAAPAHQHQQRAEQRGEQQPTRRFGRAVSAWVATRAPEIAEEGGADRRSDKIAVAPRPSEGPSRSAQSGPDSPVW
jgi:hypothetical protein